MSNLPGEIKSPIKNWIEIIKTKIKNFNPNLETIFKWFVMSNLMIFTFLIVLIIFLSFSQASERKSWYYNFFMITNSINSKPLLTVEERRKDFQMKAVGIMLVAQKDFIEKNKMTNKELTDLSALLFDKAPDFGVMDVYLPLATMKVESGFNKNAVGYHGEKGLYQMKDDTARRACQLANILYYEGIQFNIIDATKIYLAYMKFLINRFSGDLNLILLAYNLGEQKVIFESGMTVESITNTIDVKSADISKVKKQEYSSNDCYDEKVISWNINYKSLLYSEVNSNIDKITEVLNGRIKK